MKLKLSSVYAALLAARPLYERAVLDEAVANKEVAGVDAELDRDVFLLDNWISAVYDSIDSKNMANLRKAMVHLRIHAINISSIFNNLADAIEQLAFTERKDD